MFNSFGYDFYPKSVTSSFAISEYGILKLTLQVLLTSIFGIGECCSICSIINKLFQLSCGYYSFLSICSHSDNSSIISEVDLILVFRYFEMLMKNDIHAKILKCDM